MTARAGFGLRVKNAASFRRALLAWYRKHARDLPWRRSADPYTVWLSEIILQQTRVEQGLPYFERFLRAFPTVRALADAHIDEVLKCWEGLGYYTRARNLHKAAGIVAHDRNGLFPTCAEEWRALPGIGRYTAGAIASITLNERVPVLDGNVIRVLARVLDLERCTDEPRVREALWETAGALVPAVNPGDFNQAMMELGAQVCTPRAPDCARCPVRSHCTARAAGTHLERPVRRARTAAPHRMMVAAAIVRNGRYLIVQRPATGLLGGLWELPAGHVQPGETHQTAVARTLRDQLGVSAKVRGVVATADHAYSHFRVTLTVYRCDVAPSARPKANNGSHTAVKWARRNELNALALPKVMHKILPML